MVEIGVELKWTERQIEHSKMPLAKDFRITPLKRINQRKYLCETFDGVMYNKDYFTGTELKSFIKV